MLETLHTTMGEGLPQDPYMTTRVGFERATFLTQGTKITTEPPHPTKCQSCLTCKVSVHAQMNIMCKMSNVFVLLPLAMGYVQNSMPGCKCTSSFLNSNRNTALLMQPSIGPVPSCIYSVYCYVTSENFSVLM